MRAFIDCSHPAAPEQLIETILFRDEPGAGTRKRQLPVLGCDTDGICIFVTTLACVADLHSSKIPQMA
jgi:hypothetical protein